MLTQTTALLLDDVKKEILEFCNDPHGREAILGHINVEITTDNYGRYIKKLLDQRFIAPNRLRSISQVKQQYLTTQKGRNYLKAIS